MHPLPFNSVVQALRSEPTRRVAAEPSPWAMLLPALPRLGTVLWCTRLWCTGNGHLTEPAADSGLQSAPWVRAAVMVERDGPRELLCFGSERGCTTHLLCLLPDSDFLAWEQLLAALPRQARMAVPEVAHCRSQERHAFRWVQWLRGSLPVSGQHWQVRSGHFRSGANPAGASGLDFVESRSMSSASRRMAELFGNEAASLQLRIDQLEAATGGGGSTH